MKKSRIFVISLIVPLIVVVALTATVLAQSETPAPYNGMKNPFPWKDTAAQRAGRTVYLRSCFSCHGAAGNEVAQSDFSLPDYPKKLESNPGYYMWRVSEGIKDTEMAGYKFTVTETQRWQVLTYIYSLGYVAEPAPGGGTPATPGATPNATPNQTTPGGPGQPPVSGPVAPEPEPEPPPPPVLKLHVPAKAEAGKPLHLSVELTQGNETIAEAPVTFYFKIQYYTNAPFLATIGQALTDEKGKAEITFTPKATGFVPVIARYTPEGEKPIEVTATMELTADYPLYETEVGLEYKGFPPDIVLFPPSAWESREHGVAPVTVFRIPGGLPFIPFVAYLGVIILVWSLYITVMYQVLRIAPAGKVQGLNLRLLPMAGIAVLAGASALMVAILVTGPYSGHVVMP